MLARAWHSLSSSQATGEDEKPEHSAEEVAAQEEAAYQELRSRVADILEGNPVFDGPVNNRAAIDGEVDPERKTKGASRHVDQPLPQLPLDVPSEEKLRRFLRSDLYKADVAARRLRRQICWRATPSYGLDDPVRDVNANTPGVPEQISSGKCYLLKGTDAKGCPIVVVHVRRHLPSEVPPRLHFQDGSLIVSPNEVTLFGIYILDQSEERLAALAEARGLPRDPDADPDLKLCLIFDLSGIAISNVDLSVAKRIIYMLTHFYPERMGDCLLLNAPTIFTAAWMVIRPWLHVSTQERITFVKTADLPKYIPHEAIPAFWGGADDHQYPEGK